MTRAYYNENAPYAAQWLRNLIEAGQIAPGDVDDRSILDVRPADLDGYVQCHFFAGIGGWSLAARLAGWPDERPVWTGSCPCQPFSAAGQRRGFSDPRHLWPELYRLISACRPAVFMGEQVERAVGYGWADAVASDLEGIDYTFWPVVFPACSTGAFIRRDRLYFVAEPCRQRLPSAEQARWTEPGSKATEIRPAASKRDRGSPWWRHRQCLGADGLTRMGEPGLRLLAHGISSRMDVLSALGNAIVPYAAAAVIGAYLDIEEEACAC